MRRLLVAAACVLLAAGALYSGTPPDIPDQPHLTRDARAVALWNPRDSTWVIHTLTLPPRTVQVLVKAGEIDTLTWATTRYYLQLRSDGPGDSVTWTADSPLDSTANRLKSGDAWVSDFGFATDSLFLTTTAGDDSAWVYIQHAGLE